MRTLTLGSGGADVQLLQLALDRAGFGPLETDGRFGPKTREALIRFQTAHGLRPDGAAGPASHRALRPWYTGYLRHRVRPGDSFWSLARHYGASPEAIARANPGADPLRLLPGTVLTVPLPFPVVPEGIDFCSALVGFCAEGLAARHPFLRAGQIGRSVLGRPLWRLQLGRGENRVLYSAVHHANEWITAPVLLRFAEELAEACAAGGTIEGQSAAALLEYAELCLIPAVNPDGMDLVTGALPDSAYSQAARIGADYPRFPFPEGWKANIRGTDLNLQYPAGWEQARENKFAQGIRSPAPADYVGPAPLSAPESRAVADFTRRFDPALVLALHTQGEVIYWRYRGFEPVGARQIGELFADLSGYALEDAPFASGFAGYKDWFLQEFDRPGYTLELGRGRNPLPVSALPEIYERIRGVLIYGAIVT